MKRWYVVHTNANGEFKSALNLRNQGFEVYLPYFMKTRRHARQTDRVKMPLFQRYLFVRMDAARARWRAVNGTYGVNYLVCHGEHPAAVPDALIDEIQEREDTSGAVRLDKIVPFNPGESVRFVAGPMTDQTGIFECMRDEDRVVILLDLLGRPMRVTAPAAAVIAQH